MQENEKRNQNKKKEKKTTLNNVVIINMRWKRFKKEFVSNLHIPNV